MNRKTASPILISMCLVVGLLYSPPAPAPVIEFVIDKEPCGYNERLIWCPEEGGVVCRKTWEGIKGCYKVYPNTSPVKPDRTVRFYEHTNFGGNNFTLRAGAAENNLHKKGRGFRKNWGDTISSLRIGGCTTVVLWEHSNYRGSAISFKNKHPFYAEVRKMPSGWNDRVSGVSVVSKTACQ